MAGNIDGLTGMIKLLVTFGAEINACNPEGRTALQTVQDIECANVLLNCGAHPGYVSSNGLAPLTAAIVHNKHDLLKLFVDRRETHRLRGLQMLPIIAESADIETMSIIASSDLLKQILLNVDSFVAGQKILQSRTDYDE